MFAKPKKYIYPDAFWAIKTNTSLCLVVDKSKLWNEQLGAVIWNPVYQNTKNVGELFYSLYNQFCESAFPSSW